MYKSAEAMENVLMTDCIFRVRKRFQHLKLLLFRFRLYRRSVSTNETYKASGANFLRGLSSRGVLRMLEQFSNVTLVTR